MTQENITGDHIISALKTLGFTSSTEKAEAENQVSLVKNEHKVSVSQGALDADETARMRTELKPIFKTFESKVQESSDETLKSVNSWLAGSSSSN